jgi:urea transport system substrate-binding protein
MVLSGAALHMNHPSIPLGLVFSRSGPYAMMAGEMFNGAVMAVEEVNRNEEFDFTFTPHLRDPGGVVAAYPIVCSGIPLDTRASRAATTSSTSAPLPTTM